MSPCPGAPRGGGWSDPANAEAYASFAREFPMYAETSRDLVARADVSEASRVVDLCCGTGVTTEALLANLSGSSIVWSVDRSSAMLDLARSMVNDRRIRWLRAPAEEVAEHVPVGVVDAVVCNSAIWQTDLATTFAAVGRVLQPGGRFVFNIGDRFIDLGSARPAPAAAHLGQLMREEAIRGGYTPPDDWSALPRRGPRRTPESLHALLIAAGLEVVAEELLTYAASPESARGWLTIPLMSEQVCPGLPYADRMRALDAAYERFEPPADSRTRWHVTTAIAR